MASRALKRDEQPQDLLGALVFLASAESDFVTGQTIAVDGGNVNRCERFARRGGGLQIDAVPSATGRQDLWLYC